MKRKKPVKARKKPKKASKPKTLRAKKAKKAKKRKKPMPKPKPKPKARPKKPKRAQRAKKAKKRIVANNLRDAVARFETRFITLALLRNEGNVSMTAIEVGLARRLLHQRICKYGINVESIKTILAKKKENKGRLIQTQSRRLNLSADASM